MARHVERSRLQTLACPRSWMTTATTLQTAWSSPLKEQGPTGTRRHISLRSVTKQRMRLHTLVAEAQRSLLISMFIEFTSPRASQVPSSRVLRGGQGAPQNIQQGGCLVSRGHLLPELIWTQGNRVPAFVNGDLVVRVFFFSSLLTASRFCYSSRSVTTSHSRTSFKKTPF